MSLRLPILISFAGVLLILSVSAAEQTDSERDILVTFKNDGARATSAVTGAPYHNRKRYSITTEARRHARAVETEYALTRIDHWPIRSLSMYCFVYRVPESMDRIAMIDRLREDPRVESVQPLNEFEMGTSAEHAYDDTHAGLQHGLTTLDITTAHRYSRGKGVRIAIVDSHADADHEDLRGQVRKVKVFTDAGTSRDAMHGTAVASVIGASANNARGIVGIAPEARIELFVSCWAEVGRSGAICTTFTLAKAFDALASNPPEILNLSLTGPSDPLLERLLVEIHSRGVIVVAASPDDADKRNRFPANMRQVIGVGSSKLGDADASRAWSPQHALDAIYAPGHRILVAQPDNGYDFRSGSSLAAAHVSGVVALLLAVAPEMSFDTVRNLLHESQRRNRADTISVNACRVLHLADRSISCST